MTRSKSGRAGANEEGGALPSRPGKTVPTVITGAMSFAYTCLLHLLLPFFFLRLSFLGLRDAGYRQHWLHRLGCWRPSADNHRPRIVIHAVSVGEVRSAEPLLRLLSTEFPHYELLLTTTTPSGLRTARDLNQPGLLTAYLPVDIPWVIGPFLRRARPSLFILMENEIWPNLYRACHRRGIPVIIANARLSARSERRYAFLSALFQPAWMTLSMLAAQDHRAARAYARLGVPESRIHVTGNLKFDALSPAPEKEAMKTRRLWFADRPIWLAASTHPGEEEQILQVHHQLSEKLTNPLLLLAPRHPWRADSIEELCRQLGHRSVVRRSRVFNGKAIDPDVSVMLLDTLGELSFFYAMSDASFVGGSLIPHGGHNVLEPAAAGTPAVIGPHYDNFTTQVEQLAEVGILSVCRNIAELERQLYTHMHAPGRRYSTRRISDYVKNHQGAAKRICALLRPQLEGDRTD